MLSEFIAMGGYGAYVWSAYAICALVLIANIVQPVLRERRTERALKKAACSPGGNRPNDAAPKTYCGCLGDPVRHFNSDRPDPDRL